MPIVIETEEEFRARHGEECYWVDSRRSFVFADGAQLDCSASEATGRPRQKFEPPEGSAVEMAELAYDYAFAKYDHYAKAYNQYANTLRIQNQYFAGQLGPAERDDQIESLKELGVVVAQLKVVADQSKREYNHLSKDVDWEHERRKAQSEARNVQYQLDDLTTAFPTSDNVDTSDPNNYR